MFSFVLSNLPRISIKRPLRLVGDNSGAKGGTCCVQHQEQKRFRKAYFIRIIVRNAGSVSHVSTIGDL